MSVFVRLLRLYKISRSAETSLSPGPTPEENFFTEIVGFLTEQYPQITNAWLSRYAFGVHESFRSIRVRTQCRFPPPAGYEVESRVDVVLDIQRADESVDLVFIESKLASKEGWEQLDRYSKTLQEQTGYSRKWLLYVTRNYDPKQRLRSARGSSIQFRQVRWFQLHRTIKRSAPDAILIQIAEYMEQTGMSRGDRFTAEDAVAIQHLKSAIALMQATLDDEISKRLQTICGKKPAIELSDLRQHGRYIAWVWFKANWWIGIGYYKSPDDDEYPTVGLTIEVDPSSESRAIVAELRNLSETSRDWHPYNLDQPHLPAGLKRWRSLATFLGETDHVAAIRKYLATLIDDLALLKKKSRLPWEV